MQEAVSDILVERARGGDRFGPMVLLSGLAHGLLLAALVLMPRHWLSPVTATVTPMMITLNGAAGPDAGGMTPIADKAVEAVRPPDALPAPPSRPTPKAPEMAVPEPATKPAPKTPPRDKPADAATGRKPVMGPEIKVGSAAVPTQGSQTPFGGLSTGGGTPGTGVRLSVDNFCCPWYVATMIDLIRKNWNRNQGAAGTADIKFTILRDGTLTSVAIDRTSNNGLLDLESQRAVVKTRQLPPLPREFTESTLTVYLTFEYQR